MDEVAPPRAILPELSVWTFGERPSAPSGLVVVARLLMGSCVICRLSFESPRLAFSVLICVASEVTCTVVDRDATFNDTVSRRSWRASTEIADTTVSANPSCDASRV
jgi:hypothetical protein